MVDIVEEIDEAVQQGRSIPDSNFTLRRWGVRRNDRAIIVAIPNHKEPSKPHEKGVTVSELRQAFARLAESHEFSRAWFEKEMAGCAREGGCNFTAIGGIFQLLGHATHERGVYRRTERAGEAAKDK
jgi:hypothetical protein